MNDQAIFRKKCKDLLTLAAGLGLYCVISMFAHIPCPIKWFTGVSCPGCGMTRALLALCRLDFSGAVQFHPLVFYILVITPVLVFAYLKDAVKLRKWVIAVSAVLLIGVYLYRMIFLKSPVLVFDPGNGALPRLYRWVVGLLG